jgi:hypothetical protein
MKPGTCVATFGNYEGGIIGFSASSAKEFASGKGNLT